MSRTKKKKPAIRFELGWSGLFAIGIVCFCIFLWMFLLGVWTGQTMLEPGTAGSATFQGLAAKFWQETKSVRSTQKEPAATRITAPKQVKKRIPAGESVFTLQVAAFRDEAKARKVVIQWRARDYDSFYLAPEQPDGRYYRVMVGTFQGIGAAKKLAAKFSGSSKQKNFIALIPAKEKRFP